MNNKENLVGVLAIIYRWRKLIISVVVIAFIISVIVALLMPNYYRSTTTFYAASTDLAKPEMMYGATSRAMEYYGGSADIDRLLSIAESHEIKEFLVDSFSLYKHYDIEDSTTTESKIYVMDILNSLYEVKKTKYDAIEISVEDKDKFYAAKMVNAARDKIDEVSMKLIKENQGKLIRTFEKGLLEKQSELTHLDDSLINMRKKYGIYNIESQSELMGVMVAKKESSLVGSKGRLEAYQTGGSPNRDTILNLQASIKGSELELDQLTSRESKSNFTLPKFNDGLTKVEMLIQLHEQARKRFGYDLERYNQLKNAYEAKIPAVFLIENGAVPLVKSRPKRAVLVLLSVFVAFSITVIGILLLDNYKDINWKKEFND